MTEQRFLNAVLRNPVNRTLLERMHALNVPDCWLTGGAVFQTVWNVLDGRDPCAGIDDYDVFYCDPGDLSAQSEVSVRERAGALFTDLDAVIEVCNEARVHLWYGEHFRAPPPAPFLSTQTAVDHFISPVCMYALRPTADGVIEVYAPHGYADLFNRLVRPNPRLPRREVYESKTARWRQQWPALTVESWSGMVPLDDIPCSDI